LIGRIGRQGQEAILFQVEAAEELEAPFDLRFFLENSGSQLRSLPNCRDRTAVRLKSALQTLAAEAALQRQSCTEMGPKSHPLKPDLQLVET